MCVYKYKVDARKFFLSLSFLKMTRVWTFSRIYLMISIYTLCLFYSINQITPFHRYVNLNIRNTVNVQTENSVIRNILFIPGNSIQYNYVTSALLLLQLWKTIWDKISHMKNVFGDRLFEISVKAVVKALNYFTTMASRLPQVSI